MRRRGARGLAALHAHAPAGGAVSSAAGPGPLLHSLLGATGIDRQAMDLGAPTADGLTVDLALNYLGVLIVGVFVCHMVYYATMGVTLPKKGKAD